MAKVCATLKEFRQENSELEKIWKQEIWVPLESHLDKESNLVEKNYFLLEPGAVPLAVCWPRERLIVNGGRICFNDFFGMSPKALALLEINAFGYSASIGYGAYLDHAEYGKCFMFEDPQVASDVILWIYQVDNPFKKFGLSYNDKPSSDTGLESDFARKYNAKFFAHTDEADVWVLPKKGYFWFLSRTAISEIRNATDEVDQALAEYNSCQEEYREFIRFTLIPELKEVGTIAKLDGQGGLDWLELSSESNEEAGSTRHICLPDMVMELARLVHDCRIAGTNLSKLLSGLDIDDSLDNIEDESLKSTMTAIAKMMQGM